MLLLFRDRLGAGDPLMISAALLYRLMAFSVVGIPFSPSNNTPPPVWPDDFDDPDNPTAAESDGMIAAFAAFFSGIPNAVPVNV